MRKTFLWINKAGFHYNAPGNIAIGPGSKGSVFFWFHFPVVSHGYQTIWRADADAQNCLWFGFDGTNRLRFRAISGGVSRHTEWTDFMVTNYQYWVPITLTWDFTTPGAGRLRFYVDGQQAPVVSNTATAPEGNALVMYLGPGVVDASAALGGCFDNLAIWNNVMSQAQHTLLRGPATSYAERTHYRRRLPQRSDCLGDMTFLAAFNNGYNATLANGDGFAQWEVGAGNADQFCLLPDGSCSRGGRFSYRFGLPRHDGSITDRVPLQAVLRPITAHGADQYTTVINNADHSRINVSQYHAPSGMGQGMGWCRPWIDPGELTRPATLRMRVHVPSEENVHGTRMSIGPLGYMHTNVYGNNFGTWGSGIHFTVVDDPANTAGRFKVSLGSYPDNHWVGAELNLHSGNCAASRLRVSAYEGATRFVTVAGSLPGVPEPGSRGVLDFRSRLYPHSNANGENQSMEAWLWERYDTDRPWKLLECQWGAHSGWSVLRYDRGRTAYMDMTNQQSNHSGNNIMFGRHSEMTGGAFSCSIWLESIEVDGAGSYQYMGAEDGEHGRGFELADEFLLVDGARGHSSRVWRSEGCVRQTAQPSLVGQGAAVSDSFAAPGTWRNTGGPMFAVYPQDDPERITMLCWGNDLGNTRRYGYLVGQWDATAGRMVWVDEAPPTGRSNPFAEPGDFLPGVDKDASWGFDGLKSLQVFGHDDGTWSALYSGTHGNPDHYMTWALHGAADRWSFDRTRHFWPDNPLVPVPGGVDKRGPEYGGVNLFGNRDAEWMIAYNRDARDPNRRFLGFARFKTLLALGEEIGANRRPLAGWTSPNLRSFRLLPHGNAASPLAATEVFQIRPYAASDDFTCLLAMFYGSGIRLWASDDDIHFQQVMFQFLPEGGAGATFCVGERRVFYHSIDGERALSVIGTNRETCYELDSGRTSGHIDSTTLRRPAQGWGDLYVNCEGNSGTLRVEVLDARYDTPIAGLGAGNCDATGNGTARRITWNGLGLGQATAEHIRLRVHFSRSSAGAASPRLFGWRISAIPSEELKPQAHSLSVDGVANPASVTNPQPRLQWSYSDPQGRSQGAWHVIVSSSLAKLGNNEGDLWDSGITSGSAPSATYGGTPLPDRTILFWKVRVRNSEGVWSEQW